MKTNTIITIGREFGSAGREIGYKVAKEFGIKLYDKEMLARAAKESGICEEIFESHDEKPTSSFLYSLVMDTYSMGYSGNTYTDMPINHKVFLAQFDAIKKIADEGPCILVGRCADYILKDIKNCTSVYLYADREFRKNRVKEIYGSNAEIMDKEEKNRADYYNYYTGNRWGDINNYDFAINTSKVSFEEAADLIYRFAKDKQKNLKDR